MSPAINNSPGLMLVGWFIPGQVHRFGTLSSQRHMGSRQSIALVGSMGSRQSIALVGSRAPASLPGGHSVGVPPDPISNSAVKPDRANGTIAQAMEE